MEVVHHVAMERDWKRLGHALATARKAAGLTQVQVAEQVGVTKTPIQSIERGGVKGKPFKKVSGTMRHYARLVGWTDDSIERVLAGGDPTAATNAAEQAPPAERPAMTGLPLAIMDQIQGDGPLLAATMIPLPSSRRDVHMTIIVRGEPDASPEDIRDGLIAWRKTQRRLQRLADEPEDDDSTVNGT